ncbi:MULTISPECIES: hypothetical protein [Amycolatopsis]|uniref:hypothetical protein n=1 Tax=Amycolatopsis TaxID=1813 RepID=UPI001E458962|nr:MULTISPECIES: hypothetical protein [Amycolatopsis]
MHPPEVPAQRAAHHQPHDQLDPLRPRPNANYGSSSFDSVTDADGNLVALSLATVDPDVTLGAEVTVQPHPQFPVRAVVSPAPYSAMARESYRPGWRTAVPV